MEVFDIKDIDASDSYFHFTNINNIKSIAEFGLMSKIGSNSSGIEKNPKVFFSKGYKGILEANEVWIRWLATKYYYMKYGSNFLQYCNKYILDINTNNMEDDIKNIVYNKMYDILKSSAYLLLNIQDGTEFDSNDLDEYKVYNLNSNKINLIKAVYGDFSDIRIGNNNMESWNLHTKKNVGIELKNISYVMCGENNDMYSVVKYLTEKNEIEHYTDVPFLKDFMNYTLKKEQHNNMNRKR